MFAIVAPIDLDCLDSVPRKQVSVTLVKLHKPTQPTLGGIPYGRGDTVAGAWARHRVTVMSPPKVGKKSGIFPVGFAK